jgi:hypothetical protein
VFHEQYIKGSIEITDDENLNAIVMLGEDVKRMIPARSSLMLQKMKSWFVSHVQTD